MEIVSVFEIILLLSASALCIALVIFLNRVTSSVKGIQESLLDISTQIKPLIISTTALSEKLNYISEEIKDQVYIGKNIVTEVRDRVDTILDLEEKIRGGFETSIFEFIKNLSAISNAVSAFWNAYKRK
ncbi:MAG: hypothetical protein ACYC6P_13395 [Ignavibacteriaceae bacterium]|jgi:uncharacterized protein YoxC